MMNKEEFAKMMLDANKKDLIMFDASAMAKIQQEVKKKFGKEGGKLLYDICYEKEKRIIENAIPQVPLFSGTQISEIDKMMTLLDMFSVFTKLGNFGEMFDEKVDMKNKRITVRVKNNPVALSILEMYGKSDKAECTIMCGVMTGLCAAIFKKETLGKETKCICCGDDYCEFVVEAK